MNALIPSPLFDYMVLNRWLLPVTAFCCATGLIVQFRQSGSAEEKLMVIVRAAALILFLANFDPLVQTTKASVDSMVRDGLKATPDQTLQKFVTKMLVLDQASDSSSLWDKLTKTAEVIYHSFLVGLILFAVLVAFSIYFLAYLSQELALEFGIAFAPLMVGFLFFASTRSIGVQFLLYMLAIALFPLGWGAASLVSDRLIDLATAHQLVAVPTEDAHTLAVAFRTLLASLLLAIWLILSTLLAPFALIRLVTSGVHLSAQPLKQIVGALRSR
jgi:TrbL/VirB6 plasmid conjugal transfer protein